MTGTTFDTALIIAGDWKTGKSEQNILKEFFNKDSKPYDAVLIKPLSIPKNLPQSPSSETSQSETRILRSQSNTSTFKTLSISSSPDPQNEFSGNFIEQSSSSPNLFNFSNRFVPTRQNWIYSRETTNSPRIYKNVLTSTTPINVEENDEIDYQGEKAFIANKPDFVNWKGQVPLNEYPINEDDSPEIVIKKSNKQIEYDQNISVRYLKPPTPPPHGEIIIQHEKDIIPRLAPPIVIRQQPPRPITPPPLVIREAPPKPIAKLGPKIITIPGKTHPPPPRKVIIERLPQLPDKPQPIVIERWLPYKSPKRRVIYRKPDEVPTLEKQKNVIIQWETPNLVINRKYKDLGVVRANPEEYMFKYASELKSEKDLPDFAKSIKPPEGFVLACEAEEPNYVLEGDLAALSLIDEKIDGLKEENINESKSKIVRDIIEKYMKNMRNSNSNDISSLVGEIIDMVKAKTSEIITFNEATVVIKSINEKLNIKLNDLEIESYLKTINLSKNSTLEIGAFKNYLLSKYVK